ncbi:MAG: hypothetical protein KDD43_08830, partial [Bdellovibrionales bacterium]|nr:hypothetical protein [Bdellovibrionales bacterium]
EPESLDESENGNFHTIGFSYYGFNAFLVGDEKGLSGRGISGIVAHELAHAIGIEAHSEPGAVIDYGIDAARADSSGSSGFTARSFLEAILPDTLVDDLWIDSGSYSLAFHLLTQHPVDPEIVVLGGFVHKNGVFAPMHTQILPDGYVSSNSNGSYLIEAVDRSGSVTFQQLFEPTFSHSGPGHAGDVSPEISPLIITIEWIPGTIEFRVLKDGIQTTSFSAIGSSLRTAIEALPQEAMKRENGNSKQLLINRVNQIEHMVVGKNWGQVRHFLVKLRKEVRDRVIDGFDPVTPLQSSKEDIIDLIERFLLENRWQ